MLSVRTVWKGLTAQHMSVNNKFAIIAHMIDIAKKDQSLPWEQYEDMCIELRKLVAGPAQV